MVSIDNKFKGITLESLNKSSKSEIIVRMSYNPLRLGGPIAIVKCGGCETTYKGRLLFVKEYFCIEQDYLKCQCGHVDLITYRRRLK